MGYADEAAIAHALCRQLLLPFCAPEAEAVDRSVAELLTRNQALGRRCLPLRQEAGRVAVAMADPLDLDTLNELEALFGAPVDILVCAESALRKAIDRAYRL